MQFAQRPGRAFSRWFRGTGHGQASPAPHRFCKRGMEARGPKKTVHVRIGGSGCPSMPFPQYFKGLQRTCTALAKHARQRACSDPPAPCIIP